MRRLGNWLWVTLYNLKEVFWLLWKEVQRAPQLITVFVFFCYRLRSTLLCIVLIVYRTTLSLPNTVVSVCSRMWKKQIELIQLCQLLRIHIANIPTTLRDMFYKSHAVSTFLLKREEWREIDAKNRAAFPKMHKDDMRGIFFNYWGYELWQIVKAYRKYLRAHFKIGEWMVFFLDERNQMLWRNFWVKKLGLHNHTFRAIFVFLFVRILFVVVYVYMQVIVILVTWTFWSWFVTWFPRFCWRNLTLVFTVSMNLGMWSFLLLYAWFCGDKWPDFEEDYLWENVYPVDKPKTPHKHDGKWLVFRRLALFCALCWLWFWWICRTFHPFGVL